MKRTEDHPPHPGTISPARRPRGVPLDRLPRHRRMRAAGRAESRRLSNPLRWLLALPLWALFVAGEHSRTFEVAGQHLGWHGRWAPSPLGQAGLALVFTLPVIWCAAFASTLSFRIIGGAVCAALAFAHLYWDVPTWMAATSLFLSTGLLLLAPDYRRST